VLQTTKANKDNNKLKSETTLIITGLYLLVYITLIVNRFLADTVLGGGASFIIIGILIITAAVGLFKFKSLKL
jgi:dipeptide/tripeptide permease